MGNLLNQQLCDKLRDVINETDIFLKDKKESEKFLFICALMDRFDTVVKYINEHQKRPDSEEELIIFMVYSCIIKDGIDYIKKSLKIGKSEDRKIFEYIYKKEPINIFENVQFDDDKFFSYFRSLIFAHPLYTSRSIPMSEENEIQYSPYIVMEPLYTTTFIDPIGTAIYSNKREIMEPLLISFESLKEYIKGKYEELNDVITKLKEIIKEKETEWKKHKVNRNQEDIDVLKDCVNILEERYMDTDEVEKLITYLTCENSLKENIENVNKYRNEIKKIIPSICDALDLHDIEELYSIISFILFVRPKTDNKIHYQLEKIYDYLNNKNKDIDDIEWGLKQVELFAQGFSKKWVVIKPREMDYDEIKMLIRVACYLEYMEQKEGKNE